MGHDKDANHPKIPQYFKWVKILKISTTEVVYVPWILDIVSIDTRVSSDD